MIHLQQYRDAANKSAPPVTHEDVKTIAQGAVDAALQKDRAKRATVDSGQLLPESIATLELHPDICRTLLAAGIPTLENLAEKTDAQLRAIDGLSARDVNEIRVKVAMGSIE